MGADSSGWNKNIVILITKQTLMQTTPWFGLLNTHHWRWWLFSHPDK